MSGLTIEQFWQMTLKEINLYVKVMGDKRKRDLEDKRAEMYNQATLIASFVSCALGGKKIPPYREVFPDSTISKEDEERFEKQRQAIQRDAWLAWADTQNQFWKRRHQSLEGSEEINGDTATTS